jgi:hypothetical protein
VARKRVELVHSTFLIKAMFRESSNKSAMILGSLLKRFCTVIRSFCPLRGRNYSEIGYHKKKSAF